MMRAHIPGVPPRPGETGWPPTPPVPLVPGPVPPTRVWLDPHADWKNALYERLLAKRIVLASGFLDDDAAARLSAQLLTLDADQADPIRLRSEERRVGKECRSRW